MGSCQGTASAVPPCAPRPRRSEGAQFGKGTSFTRADKTAIRSRLQALRDAFAAKTIGSVPPVPVLSRERFAGKIGLTLAFRRWRRMNHERSIRRLQ